MRAKQVNEEWNDLQLSQNDSDLIADALRKPYIDWASIYEMIEMADSQEAKDELLSIAKQKYREEEHSADTL